MSPDECARLPNAHCGNVSRVLWSIRMAPRPSTDRYALGMVHWTADELELTPTLDRWHFELLRPYLGCKVLEVGAGPGRITALVAGAAQHDELLAIEPSPHFFELLRSHVGAFPGVSLLQTETGRLGSEYANHFDTVYSVHVMEHIADDLRFLKEMLALTRPQGAVVVLVPALPFLFSELDRNVGHFRRYTKKMIRTLAQGLPVKIERLAYNNLLGAAGSLYFSKVRKINYQKDDAARRKFFGIYHFFSEYVVPAVQGVERFVPVPLGLNLTAVLRKQ